MNKGGLKRKRDVYEDSSKEKEKSGLITDTKSTDDRPKKMRKIQPEKYKFIVSGSVLSSILSHAFSDSHNEIIGLLGGRVDDRKGLVYVTHTYSCVRDIKEISPITVSAADGEGKDETVLGLTYFNERGVGILGWYHSHPNIRPYPSQRDITMQNEWQHYGKSVLGIICMPFHYRSNKPNEIESCFTFFRVVGGSSDQSSKQGNPGPVKAAASQVVDLTGDTATIYPQINIIKPVKIDVEFILESAKHPNNLYEEQRTLQTVYNESIEQREDFKNQITENQKKPKMRDEEVEGEVDSDEESGEKFSVETLRRLLNLFTNFRNFAVDFFKNTIPKTRYYMKEDFHLVKKMNQQLRNRIQKYQKDNDVMPGKNIPTFEQFKQSRIMERVAKTKFDNERDWVEKEWMKQEIEVRQHRKEVKKYEEEQKKLQVKLPVPLPPIITTPMSYAPMNVNQMQQRHTASDAIYFQTLKDFKFSDLSNSSPQSFEKMSYQEHVKNKLAKRRLFGMRSRLRDISIQPMKSGRKGRGYMGGMRRSDAPITPVGRSTPPPMPVPLATPISNEILNAFSGLGLSEDEIRLQQSMFANFEAQSEMKKKEEVEKKKMQTDGKDKDKKDGGSGFTGFFSNTGNDEIL